MHEIPSSKPVAYRMPCCDSLNTVSPRFFTEIFNKTTKKGNFLQIDSSVFNVFTSNDPELPKALVQNADGSERFRKYLPKDRSFVNYIEDYPYPYVIGRLCWQFPCMTPSDWQAQHLHKPNNPQTVKDWKAALDCTVIKKGVFCLVFHPWGWIRNDQVVELIDYAAAKYGKKVKFLNFREALERLNENLLVKKSLRTATGGKRRVGMFDLDKDGFLDVVFKDKSRIWRPKGAGSWKHTDASLLGDFLGMDVYGINLAALREKVADYCIVFSGGAIFGSVSNDTTIYKLPKLSLPKGIPVRKDGKDPGFRFVDLDGDGNDDIIFSNEKEYGIYLFKDMKTGWSRKIMAGKREDKDALPMISRNGTNNGFWVHSGSLWWSNEDTVLMKDHVDRRSIKELLKGKKR
jgi:hypothetical protein